MNPFSIFHFPVPTIPLPLALLLGFILSAFVGYLAYRRGSLTRNGIAGAMLTGTIIFGFGGIVAGALLVAFFVSSSFWSHWCERDKEPLAEKFQKGARRDLAQAMANGGMASLCALAYYFSTQPIFFAALVGALATVTADTWATEIGVLSKSAPRLITNMHVVPVGTSGGISTLGTFIAFLGATFIGFAAMVTSLGVNLFLQPPLQSLPPIAPLSLSIPFDLLPGTLTILLPLIASLSGLLGSLFDSLLGATVQAIYYCDYDQKETESAVHKCRRATRLVRGWRWLDNDGVNFIASLVGAFVAAAFYSLLTR